VNRRDAVAEDLRALADDLRSLYESATTDPKERRRKERRWSALEGTLGVLTTLVARRLVVKLWGILTGEEVPKRPPTEQAKRSEHRPETTTDAAAETTSEPPTQVIDRPPAEIPPEPLTQAMAQPEAVTMPSSSSSVK
jgi:hypothetical protein